MARRSVLSSEEITMDSITEHVDGNYTIFVKSEPPPVMEASDLQKFKNPVMLTLLALYEEQRCLWDPLSKFYANRLAREDAWAYIFAYYKKHVIDPDERRMRRIIESARHSWRRDYRLVKASMSAGNGDTVYQPKLWYFSALNFLAEVERDKIDVDNDITGTKNDNVETLEILTTPISANDLLRYKNPVLIKLFSLYEQNRCLWDTSDVDYLNRRVREDAWDTLFNYYKTVVTRPDSKRMRRILGNARSAWRTEFREAKASMAAGNYHQPKLWYYDALNFLAADAEDSSADGTDMENDHAYPAYPQAIDVEQIPSGDDSADAHEREHTIWVDKMSGHQLLKMKNPLLTHLFSLYERHRCLWDPRDKNYGKGGSDVRRRAWAVLFKYYKKITLNPDVKRMRSVILNARRSWRREFGAVKASMLTGDGETVYQPKLWYYDALNFLAEIELSREETDTDNDVNGLRMSSRSVTQPKSLSDTYSFEVVDEDGNDVINDLSEQEVLVEETLDPLESQPKKRKSDLAVQAKKAMIEAVQKLLSSDEEDNMWVTQGKVWGQRLITMDSKQRAIAVKLVGDVLYYADMKMLSPANTFNPGSSS